MKVLSIEDEKFTPVVDLRKARKSTVYFSGSLAWSPLRGL